LEHAASTLPLIVALEQSALGAAMRQSLFLYPAVETLHIIGLALLVGGIAVFDLRMLGAFRAASSEAVARAALPVAIAGFALAVPMGLLLFATEATHLAANVAFRAKLVFIAAALANALFFRLGAWRKVIRGSTLPPSARVGAAVSLLAWVGAIAGGRLIAYF
jgi:hypothetical protein